jgi:solute carrier family 25 S-adenosylmethionine transporter 26
MLLLPMTAAAAMLAAPVQSRSHTIHPRPRSTPLHALLGHSGAKRHLRLAAAPTSASSSSFPARARTPLALIELSLDGATQHSGLAAFSAAFAASCVATVALHPVDTMKTRQQAMTFEDGDMACMWRGVSANVLKEAPDAAVFLALSETLSQSLAYNSPWFASHLTMTLMLAGAIGDAVGSIFRLPAEVLCKRLQTDSAIGWSDALSGTSKASWMAAWEAIVYRDVPFGGLQIAAYREARLAIGASLGAISTSLPDSASDCLAGLLAGAFAAALTTPLDVLVTHVTTANEEEGEEGLTPGGRRKSPFAVGATLVREQGLQSLTRGIGPRTVYYAWVCAAFFGLYEAFRRYFEAHGL